MPPKKDPRLERAGVSGYNKPKRTPNHPTKSHVVVAKEGDQIKTIRFGQQGVSGSPTGTQRNKDFKSRHGKNIAKEKCRRLIGPTRRNGQGRNEQLERFNDFH